MIDEVLRYVEEIQISQDESLAQVDGKIDQAIGGLTNADTIVANTISDQEELIASLRAAAEHLAVLGPLAAEARIALDAAGDGRDTDEDGLADSSEGVIARVSSAAGEVELLKPLSSLSLDPENIDTALDEKGDLASATEFVSALENEVVQLGISLEKKDVLLDAANRGLDILLIAQQEQLYAIDIQAVADATFGGNVEEAERAVGVFQSTCARCHTAGYTSGPAFTQEVGSGALGPALWGGRANVGFLDQEQMLAFIANGSELGQGYGINGIGRGYMPGFGTVLSEDDLALLITYLRGGVLR